MLPFKRIRVLGLSLHFRFGPGLEVGVDVGWLVIGVSVGWLVVGVNVGWLVIIVGLYSETIVLRSLILPAQFSSSLPIVNSFSYRMSGVEYMRTREHVMGAAQGSAMSDLIWPSEF